MQASRNHQMQDQPNQLGHPATIRFLSRRRKIVAPEVSVRQIVVAVAGEMAEWFKAHAWKA